MNKSDLQLAVKAAMAGHWDVAHNIAQQYQDVTANWLHAVLHKIEGDDGNSRYWYAKSAGKQYDDFCDENLELLAIEATITGKS